MTSRPPRHPTPDAPLEVGFVGLGVMGRPMARRIIAAGFPLLVHSRSSAAIAQLVAGGARAASSPADVTRATEVVIVMVPDAPDLRRSSTRRRVSSRAPMTGSSWPPWARIIPLPCRRWRSTAPREASVCWTLRSPAARSARSRAACRSWSVATNPPTSALPVFEAMGRTIVHVGASGAGQLTKACNQVIVGATIAPVAEGPEGL